MIGEEWQVREWWGQERIKKDDMRWKNVKVGSEQWDQERTSRSGEDDEGSGESQYVRPRESKSGPGKSGKWETSLGQSNKRLGPERITRFDDNVKVTSTRRSGKNYKLRWGQQEGLRSAVGIYQKMSKSQC